MKKRRNNADDLSLAMTAITFTIEDDCDAEELFDVLEKIMSEQSFYSNRLCKKNKKIRR